MTKAIEKKAPLNIKTKVVKNENKKQLVITVDLEDYSFDNMVNADISKYVRVGEGKKRTVINGKEVYVENPDANIVVATTNNQFVSLEMEGFEHIGFEMKAIAKYKPIKDEQARIYTMEQQRQLAKEIQAEQQVKSVPTPAMPTMSAEDMELFQQFMQFKQMMAAAKQ